MRKNRRFYFEQYWEKINYMILQSNLQQVTTQNVKTYWSLMEFEPQGVICELDPIWWDTQGGGYVHEILPNLYQIYSLNESLLHAVCKL